METLETRISWDNGVPFILLGTRDMEGLQDGVPLTFSNPRHKSLVILKVKANSIATARLFSIVAMPYHPLPF